MEYGRSTFRPLASARCTLKSNVPAAVGVPVIAPPEDRFNPGGSAAEPVDNDHV